jgi:hypothetical protein
MRKNAMKCNKTQSKWCINKHGSSKIIDTFETYYIPEDQAAGNFAHPDSFLDFGVEGYNSRW